MRRFIPLQKYVLCVVLAAAGSSSVRAQTDHPPVTKAQADAWMTGAASNWGKWGKDDAKITAGFKLKAKYIVHAVGPIWRGGGWGEPELLASCYRRSLELAAGHNARSIAFPSIGTGTFGYPIELAARPPSQASAHLSKSLHRCATSHFAALPWVISASTKNYCGASTREGPATGETA